MFYPNEKLDDESIQLEPSTPRLVLEGIMEQMPEEHIETVLGTFMELRPVIEFDEYVNQDSLALHPREFRVLRSILKAETLGKALDSATAGGHVSRKCAISIAYVLHEAGVLKLK